MYSVATLVLLLSFPVSHYAPSPKVQKAEAKLPAIAAVPRPGQWYLAQTGHAVFCYGPVVTVPDVRNGLEHVATFCAGEKPMVPLKD
jgi:hypothetical protein